MSVKIDRNGFLSIGDVDEYGKEYTRSFYGYNYTNYDHTVLLYNKGQIQEQQWKDIGEKQQVLRYRQQYTPYSDKPDMEMVKAGFNILYTRDDMALKVLTKHDKDVEKYIHEKELFTDNAVYEFLDEYLHDKNIVAYLFGMLLAHGNWTIKNGVLFPPKLVLPLTSSLFGQKGNIEKIFERLEYLKLAHSFTFHYSSTFEYCQAMFYDTILLKQWKKWLENVFDIEKTSVADQTERAYDALKEYACSADICIDWKYDFLQILPCD